MTCAHVRTLLRTEPVSAWASVQDHLERCADCAVLAAVLRERTDQLEAQLEDFAHQPSFDAAFAAASEDLTPAPAPAQGDRTMFDSGIHIALTAAAAAAALGFGLYATSPTAIDPAEPFEAATTAESVCADFTALEPAAMTGELSDKAVTCLEDRIEADDEAATSLQLLTVDAFSRGDTALWEQRAEHLAALTPDDPDLHYKLALHFSKQGVEGAEKTIHYAEAAHENRTTWTGDTYVKRVNNLMKLRASAALTRWQAAPDDDEARLGALRFAREWLDYTRAAGLDSSTAERVCLSAGTEQDCAD